MTTNNILMKAVELTDWLISVGASQDLTDDLLRDLFDVYGVSLDDYWASATTY